MSGFCTETWKLKVWKRAGLRPRKSQHEYGSIVLVWCLPGRAQSKCSETLARGGHDWLAFACSWIKTATSNTGRDERQACATHSKTTTARCLSISLHCLSAHIQISASHPPLLESPPPPSAIVAPSVQPRRRHFGWLPSHLLPSQRLKLRPHHNKAHAQLSTIAHHDRQRCPE